MQIVSSALRFVATTAIAATVTTTAFAESNILYILDASNSMWGHVDGVPKIEVAKNVLSDLLKKTPSNINIGLLTYGHRLKDACDDIELITPVGGSGAAGIISALKGITPKGKTPIAGALSMALESLQNRLEENNTVVVISDGVETCDGDPCAAAKALATAGVNTRVHVVGFDIGADERKQLQCISENGNGQYFPASNAAELTTAIAQVQTIAQAKPEPKPEPKPAPKPVEYFRDDFDGEVLNEHWEVLNRDPDGYIVENGFLNILSSTELTLYSQSEKLPNLFKLNKPLPNGDWTATLRVKPAITTFRENYSLALYTDKNNFLVADIYPGIRRFENGKIVISLDGSKFSRGQRTAFGAAMLSSKKLGHFDQSRTRHEDWVRKHVKAVLLRIRKKGRSYFVSAKIEGDPVSADGQPEQWVELEKLTSLRVPGKFLAISIGQGKYKNSGQHLKGGETLANVDWIKIETMD